MGDKKLYRSCKNRILGGVAGGLAEYLEIDVTIVRLITILVMLSGAGIVAYIVGWVIIPINPECDDKRTGAEEIRDSAERIAEEVRSAVKDSKNKRKTESANWLGWVFVILGAFLLLETVVGFDVWTHFWPVVLILLGFVLITRGLEK